MTDELRLARLMMPMRELRQRLALLRKELKQKGVKMTYSVQIVLNGADVTIKLRQNAPGAVLPKDRGVTVPPF